jgi:hypothetical protein
MGVLKIVAKRSGKGARRACDHRPPRATHEGGGNALILANRLSRNPITTSRTPLAIAATILRATAPGLSVFICVAATNYNALSVPSAAVTARWRYGRRRGQCWQARAVRFSRGLSAPPFSSKSEKLAKRAEGSAPNIEPMLTIRPPPRQIIPEGPRRIALLAQPGRPRSLPIMSEPTGPRAAQYWAPAGLSARRIEFTAIASKGRSSYFLRDICDNLRSHSDKFQAWLQIKSDWYLPT